MKLNKNLKRKLKKYYLFLQYLKVKTKVLFKYGTFDMFNNLDIDINTTCNRRCSYCPNSTYDRGLKKNEKLMEIEVYHKIINDLAEINFTGVISPLFYGEPLLRKDLIEIVKYTREKLPKSTIKLNSNGDFLTVEKYLDLIKAGINKFIITQHGEEHSPNMLTLLAYIKKNPNKKVRFVYHKYEEDEPLYNRGGLVKLKKVDPVPRCHKPDNPLVIDWDGNIVLCCNDYFSSVKFGNVKDKKIMDIWNKKSFKKVRKDLKASNFKLEICKKCVTN